MAVVSDQLGIQGQRGTAPRWLSGGTLLSLGLAGPLADLRPRAGFGRPFAALMPVAIDPDRPGGTVSDLRSIPIDPPLANGLSETS